MIRQYAPTTVRHLDDTINVPYTQLCWRCAGHGHPDHIASARLVREAMLRVPGNYAEAGYIDYPSQERASNLDPAEIAGKSVIFQHYAWNDYHYCAGPSGCKEPARPPPPGCSAPITYRARTSRRSFTPTGAAGWWCSPPARPMRPSIAGTQASAAGRVWAAAPTGRWSAIPMPTARRA